MRFLGGMRMAWAASQLVIAFLFLSCSVPARAEPKRVLLLHSYGRDFAPWSEYAKHFRAEWSQQSNEPIDLFETSVAGVRFGENQQEGPFVEYLRVLFTDRPPDLVVSIGAPAGRFFQQYRQQLFPNTPLLLVAIEQRRLVETTMTANDTAVAGVVDIAATISNILTVLPETSHIAVVIGNSPPERFWTNELKAIVAPLTNRVTFTFLNDLTFPEMLERAAALPPNSAIFFAVLSVDAAGVPYNDNGQAFPRLRAVANAPIFSYDDSQFGSGNVGGPLLSIRQISRRAAEVAIRILGGELPSSLRPSPIEYGPHRFDWRELERWGIREANLPPGSIVEFRQPTFWAQHRWTILVTLAIVLTQSGMIASLLFERRRRRLAEATSHRRFIEMTQMNRSLTVSTMSSAIAHELNQPLGAILNNAEAAEILLTKDPPDIAQLREIIVDIRNDDKRAGDIISHLRKFLRKSEIQLHHIDMNRVIDEVRQIIEPEAAKRGIEVEVNRVTQPLAVRADRVHLQQVLLNLALNGMDAMQDMPNPRKMIFEATLATETEVEVSVLDTGSGIPNQKLNDIFETFFTTKRQGTGLGLSIARTIVEMYGGRIWAENRKSGGAAFRVVLPLAGARA